MATSIVPRYLVSTDPVLTAYKVRISSTSGSTPCTITAPAISSILVSIAGNSGSRTALYLLSGVGAGSGTATALKAGADMSIAASAISGDSAHTLWTVTCANGIGYVTIIPLYGEISVTGAPV